MAARSQPGRFLSVLGLGCAQLVAWGALYYATGALAEAMRRELGLSENAVYLAFSLSLALAGGLTPCAGRLVDRHGGRVVLVTSCVLGAAGLAMLASSTHVLHVGLGYALMGASMALGLYEVCFATLAQVFPATYRRDVTSVTLLGGLASSAFWPLSRQLEATLGVRAALFIYAAMLLACALAYLSLLPGRTAVARPPPSHATPNVVTSRVARFGTAAAARRVAFACAAATAVAAALTAHIFSALHTIGLDGVRAVWLAATVGVLQVAGRLLERIVGRSTSGIALGMWSLTAMAAAVACLLLGSLQPHVFGPLFTLLFGLANGVLTIVKAVVPLELDGGRPAGAAIAALGWPSLLARAAAPAGFAGLSSAYGVHVALVATCALSCVSVAIYAYATRQAV